ncbi:hypothetical protein SNR37_002222 [Agarivorans aestuarii]|uniref:Uncharacterized protein n=1 Tax=Agarivorans aestuarii TaxID=1563703 RepID=A0ABU7G0L9_9ALTE|nr:hypothetical protein [Agarivorans aestuarii]MEE1672812.1 hypothetical protein [Agarivorans aestuarii]
MLSRFNRSDVDINIDFISETFIAGVISGPLSYGKGKVKLRVKGRFLSEQEIDFSQGKTRFKLFYEQGDYEYLDVVFGRASNRISVNSNQAKLNFHVDTSDVGISEGWVYEQNFSIDDKLFSVLVNGLSVDTVVRLTRREDICEIVQEVRDFGFKVIYSTKALKKGKNIIKLFYSGRLLNESEVMVSSRESLLEISQKTSADYDAAMNENIQLEIDRIYHNISTGAESSTFIESSLNQIIVELAKVSAKLK